MWHMYGEISGFWNHQYVICHPNWLYLHAVIIDEEHRQKLCKNCSCCGRYTWHIESKQMLQPPKYLIIIVNRITYSNNRITMNKSRMHLDLYIKLGPHKFPYKLLWTIMDTLWTVVITQPQSIVVGEHFTVMIIKLLNVKLRTPIIHLLPVNFYTNASWNVSMAVCP